MKKNIFKYLRKKILEHSTITEEVFEFFHSYKIECLGFTETINLPLPLPNIRFTDSLLIDKLVEKHGNIVRNIIKYQCKMGDTIQDIFKSYLKMPDLHLITNMFDSQRYDIIKETYYGK